MAAVSYGQIGSGSGSDWERIRSDSGAVHLFNTQHILSEKMTNE